MEDIYKLERFQIAQDTFPDSYELALSEIKNGRKENHWIWYIFPNMKGLGQSYNSYFYGISSLDEAKAYLKHPVLGKRLIEISEAVLSNYGKVNVYALMGSAIDRKKLQSCMTLFHIASPDDPIFKNVLDSYFHGSLCKKTLEHLGM